MDARNSQHQTTNGPQPNAPSLLAQKGGSADRAIAADVLDAGIMADSPIHSRSFVPCPVCKQPLQEHSSYALEYFEGKKLTCLRCGTAFDWWDAILRLLKDVFSKFYAFSALQAKFTLLQVMLPPGKRTLVRFSEHGVPANARILHVSYTPIGGEAFPVETHSNDPVRHFVPSAVNLFPVPNVSGHTTDQEVTIAVLWVENAGQDEAWQNLIDAVEAFAQGRYAAMVVPANVAVEAILRKCLFECLEGIASKDRLKTFFREAATYSHQLNVLQPLLALIARAPKLPNHIRGHLNRLRDLRNDLAHDGTSEVPLDKKAAAECLCGALFGFQYVRLVHPLLLKGIKKQPTSEPPLLSLA